MTDAPVQIICGEAEDIEAVLGRSLNAPLSAEEARSDVASGIFRAKMTLQNCSKWWFEDDEDDVPTAEAARRQLPHLVEALEALVGTVVGIMRLAGEPS